MKLTYTPTTNKIESVNPGVIKAPDYKQDFSGAQAMAGAMDKWAQAIEKVNQEEDNRAILDAMDQYNKAMYSTMNNNENGLMRKEGRAASSIMGDYMAQEKTTREGVLAGVKLHNPKSKYALQALMNKTADSNYQSLQGHYYKQMDVVENIRRSDILENAIKASQDNIGNYDYAKQQYEQSKLLLDASYSPDRYGEDVKKEYLKQNATKYWTAVADQALLKNDFAMLNKIKSEYGQYISADQRQKLTQVAYQKEHTLWQQNLAKEARKVCGDDPVKIQEWIKAHSGFVSSSGNDTFENFLKAISGQESGGNYSAENGRTGAYGKYQIMPENWPQWAQEAGLDANAEPTPENQEKVAQFKLKQYYDKYGARGAAIAWYAGEGALSGDTDLDSKQGNGDEPSINEYADSVLSRMGGEASGPISDEESKKILNMALTEINTEKNIKNLQNQKIVNDFSAKIEKQLQTQRDKFDYQAAIQSAMELGGNDMKLTDKLIKEVNDWVQVFNNLAKGGPGGKLKIEKGGVEAIERMIAQGTWTTRSSMNRYASSKGANATDLKRLDTYFDHYWNGTGPFKFPLKDWAEKIVGNKLKGADKIDAVNNAVEWGKTYVRDYMALHNGATPEKAGDIYRAMEEAAANITVGSKSGNYEDWAGTKIPTVINQGKVVTTTKFDVLAKTGFYKYRENPDDDNTYIVTDKYGIETEVNKNDFLSKLEK